MNLSIIDKGSCLMNKKKIIITGINGFVGKNFLNVLKKLSHDSDVYGVDRRFGKTDDFTSIKCELTEKKSVKSMLSEVLPDYIFHFAGTAYDQDWNNLLNGNVKSTLSLLESVSELAMNPRIVIIGSASEYGNISQELLPVLETTMPNPASLYGTSMCCRTNVALAYRNMGCDITIGRVFNITGCGVSENSPIGSFSKQIAQIEKGQKEPVIHTGNLNSVRDFIDIMDIAKAFYYLGFKSNKGGIYNVCSGNSNSIKQILDILLNLSTHQIKIVTDIGRFRERDISIMIGNNQKIKYETGWEPAICLEESLKETLDSYRKSIA